MVEEPRIKAEEEPEDMEKDSDEFEEPPIKAEEENSEDWDQDSDEFEDPPIKAEEEESEDWDEVEEPTIKTEEGSENCFEEADAFLDRLAHRLSQGGPESQAIQDRDAQG